MPAVPRRIVAALHARVAVPVLTFVLPTPCFACGRPLERFQHLGACLACWNGFAPARPPACPACPGCALPRPHCTDLLGPARGRCSRCTIAPPAMAEVRAAVLYDGHARVFLLRAKLSGHRELLPPLALQMAAVATGSGMARGCERIVPVPSHPLMTLRRGFRPAAGLARVVAARVGLPCSPGLLGVRLGARLVAKRLGARQRRHDRGVFVVRGRLGGGPVLLIDDVMTTGASLDGCARALLEAGASEVRALVWARRLPPP